MRAALAEIDLKAVRDNLLKVREAAPKARVLAIVKADGYGHGLEAVAKALAAQGVDGFGVASIDDAQRLRGCGISERIVLLSGFDEPEDFRWIDDLRLDCVIHHRSQLELLAAAEFGKTVLPLRLWVKMDSGMRRLGFTAAELPEVLARLRSDSRIDKEIILMSHFAQADEVGRAQRPEELEARAKTVAQILVFDNAVANNDECAKLAHSLANSGALLSTPESHRQWVRPGGVLYGLSTHDRDTGAELGFQPAMRLSTKLVSVKEVSVGDRVGYGGTFVVPAPMRIGIAAIGYGDGYPRHAPTGTPVLVGGQRARTIGRVAMDLLTVDLTGVSDAEVGTEVLLWGPELPVEIIARAAETISYELSCGVTKRVRFRYIGAL